LSLASLALKVIATPGTLNSIHNVSKEHAYIVTLARDFIYAPRRDA
jgi:hypothetical protein